MRHRLNNTILIFRKYKTMYSYVIYKLEEKWEIGKGTWMLSLVVF